MEWIENEHDVRNLIIVYRNDKCERWNKSEERPYVATILSLILPFRTGLPYGARETKLPFLSLEIPPGISIVNICLSAPEE